MALYSVSIRQSWDIPGINRRKWSNVVFIDAPNADAAAAAGIGLWEVHLRNAARTNVFCYEVYATSVTQGDDDYAVQVTPEAFSRGTLPIGNGEPYAPKNCLSVTLRAVAGRPSRKFWRPGLWEGDVVAGQAVGAALVAAVETAWSGVLAENIVRDPDNQALIGAPLVRFTSRAFGRESAENLPSPPPAG